MFADYSDKRPILNIKTIKIMVFFKKKQKFFARIGFTLLIAVFSMQIGVGQSCKVTKKLWDNYRADLLIAPRGQCGNLVYNKSNSYSPCTMTVTSSFCYEIALTTPGGGLNYTGSYRFKLSVVEECSWPLSLVFFQSDVFTFYVEKSTCS